MKIMYFYCLFCNGLVKKKTSSTNTYCNNTCSSSHFLQKSHERLQRGEVLSRGSSATIKKYLIKTRGNKCEECPQGPIHNNKPLTLQLDHIDGNSENMALENLRLLCPNCHTQTDTYGNKNKRIAGKRKDYYTNNREKDYYK